MKKVLILICMMQLAASCPAEEMPQVAKDLHCTNCHAIDHKIVGPAWLDISKRYHDKLNDQSVFDKLVKRVSLGGQGNWGELPMVANDPSGKKHDQIVELVKFILSLSGPLAENKR